MDKINFSSEFHTFGNYLVKFKRSTNGPINKINIVNIMEIYSQEKQKIMDLRFDIKTAIYLYGIMLGLTNDYAEFEYELPIYNATSEITRISGIVGFKLPSEVMPKFSLYLNQTEYQRNMNIEEEIYDSSILAATLIISKENDEDKIAEVTATFTLEDFDKFVYIFYFLLLIDVIDPSYQFYR